MDFNQHMANRLLSPVNGLTEGKVKVINNKINVLEVTFLDFSLEERFLNKI